MRHETDVIDGPFASEAKRALATEGLCVESTMIAAFNELIQAHPLNAMLVAICCIGVVMIRQMQRQKLSVVRRDQHKP